MHPYSQDIEPTATQNGEFSDGNPQLNRARTILRSYWPNMIQRELLSVLQAAGITPEQENYQQVRQAVQSLINSGDASVLGSAKTYADGLDTAVRAYINQQVASALAQANQHADQSFIGQISTGPYGNIPYGWRELNGASFTRNQYPQLATYIDLYYAPIGVWDRNAYPGRFAKSGDTYYLPNMSGLFVRGLGGNAAALGQWQQDAIRNITGVIGPFAQARHSPTPVGSSAFRAVSSTYNGRGADGGAGTSISLDVSRVVPTAAENRPINVAWRYIIRAI